MTDQTLLTTLQYALLEPPDAGQNWPSGLWSRDEVLQRLTERQDRYLKETQILVSAATTGAVAIGAHRIALPTDWIATVSAVWHENSGGLQRDLIRGDQYSADALIPTWEGTNADPLVYHDFDPPTLIIEIGPAPTVAGVIDLLYVASGTALNGNGVSLALPDEICDAGLKYGVLADLLGKDGRGRDPQRAAYAEERYQLAIELGRLIVSGWA